MVPRAPFWSPKGVVLELKGIVLEPKAPVMEPKGVPRAWLGWVVPLRSGGRGGIFITNIKKH